MKVVGLAVLPCLLLALGGCRTLHAEREEFTRESARNEICGYYPEILEVKDDGILVRDSIKGGAEPLVIKYSDIVRVQVSPQTKAFVLWIFVATLYGPFLYDMEVVLKNGWTVPVIRKCRWALSFTPFGYYPNVLIHGYGPGYALDWLRQDATGWKDTEGASRETGGNR